MKLINRVEISKPEVVYNLQVKNNHNYIANSAVVSNCHGSKATKLFQLLTEHGKNLVHRYGLTGTLPKPEADKLNVHVALGKVLCEYSAHSLIQKGWLATLNINVIQLNDIQYLLDRGVPDEDVFKIMYEEENNFCKTNVTRMKWIARFVSENRNKNKLGNTLVLVNNIKYGRQLSKEIEGSYFLNGADDVKVRDEVYALFEDNDDLIVICTKQIAGVGLSIDRIFNLIFIDSGKSFVGTIQSIGRGLRKGKDKDSVNVIDICSNLSTAPSRMKKRLSYYKTAHYPYKVIKMDYSKEVDDDEE